jgi:hypothetical protein
MGPAVGLHRTLPVTWVTDTPRPTYPSYDERMTSWDFSGPAELTAEGTWMPASKGNGLEPGVHL